VVYVEKMMEDGEGTTSVVPSIHAHNKFYMLLIVGCVYVYLVKVNAVTVWPLLVLCNAPVIDTRGLVIPLS
jgi:hypothetical protein